MKERKFVKLRVDMYGDTKFKIIDTMEERDLIHYIWTRLLTLAGKVNLEGELYMSRNIPYSTETLAIEFNRSVSKIELALNVFKDLEMIELSENNVYRVKNFAKHQNIKVKEKVEKLDDKKEFNDKKNLTNNEGETESQTCEDVKKVSKNSNKNKLNNELKTQNCKPQANTIIEKSLDRNCNDPTYQDVCNKNKEAEKTSKKCAKDVLNNQNCTSKETKNISEKEADKNNDYILNKKSNIEACTEISTRLKENKKETNKKKKAKKKSKDIEELFFEEDIVEPAEWSDEPILKGELVKSFNF